MFKLRKRGNPFVGIAAAVLMYLAFSVSKNLDVAGQAANQIATLTTSGAILGLAVLASVLIGLIVLISWIVSAPSRRLAKQAQALIDTEIALLNRHIAAIEAIEKHTASVLDQIEMRVDQNWSERVAAIKVGSDGN